MQHQWLSLGLVDESSWSIEEEASCWMKTIPVMREDREMLLPSAAPSLSFLTPLAKCMLTQLAEGSGDANSSEGRRCVHWTLSPLVLTSLFITLMDRGSLSVSAGWPGSPPPSALASSLRGPEIGWLIDWRTDRGVRKLGFEPETETAEREARSRRKEKQKKNGSDQCDPEKPGRANRSYSREKYSWKKYEITRLLIQYENMLRQILQHRSEDQEITHGKAELLQHGAPLLACIETPEGPTWTETLKGSYRFWISFVACIMFTLYLLNFDATWSPSGDI